ncbi:MAG: signal peptidase II [Oleispira sp.]|nr:signal peptidase II [Oleispira sp.]MBL4880817.1 signal peptidase II [Oleispira sp.]
MSKFLIIFISLTSLIGCDRVTKIQAIENLKNNEPLSYFGGMFKLTYHENIGAMLSLGSGLSDELRYYIFTIAAGVVLLSGLIYISIKPLPKLHLFLASLFIGGGFGNLYDRVFNDGAVVDFMLIVLGPVRTGVFNVADVAIMVGGIGLMILSTDWGKQLTSQSTSRLRRWTR